MGMSRSLMGIQARMELRQLAYFVAVAEARHFGRAARGLRIAPPSLSQQIRVLERDLGVVLLHRDARDVRLTPAGAALLSHARALLARADAARCAVRSAVPGMARIGLRVAPGAHAVIGAALCGLAAMDPEVMVSVAVCPDADAVHAVRQERAAAAVVWDGRAAGSRSAAVAVADGLAYAELARVPVTAVLPPGHPLAAGSHVSAAALGDAVVLLPDRDFAPALWDGIVARLGLPNDLLCTMGDPAGDGAGAVLRGVATGRGVAVLPEPMAALEPLVGDGPAVVALPLDPPLDVGLHLLWRDPVQPALRRVLEALRSG
jgi:DNA-binding transcriptional LysR family regulator